METLVSKALIIRLSLQPAPASETSAFNNIRAFSSRWAGLLPFRINASSRSRSSSLSRTTYFFTEISLAAIIVSVARVATESNHKKTVPSNYLKRTTSEKGLPRQGQPGAPQGSSQKGWPIGCSCDRLHVTKDGEL